MTGRAKPRSRAGATILQIVPSLTDDPAGHAAVDIARTLVAAGARAIVAGDEGTLVGELRSYGGEYLRMPGTASFNPWRIHANAATIAKLIAAERVDIVHAQHAAAAWSALRAANGQPIFLVTSFADRLPTDRWPGPTLLRSLARGQRVIAPSSCVSVRMMERYGIPPERITVIPRAVDTATFSPAAISAERIAGLRRIWALPPGMRTVVIAGRVTPWNGQMSMVDAARLVLAEGRRDIAFVFVGDDRTHPRTAANLKRRAALHGIDTLCRFVGHCPDVPAAMAAADLVVVPALRPPLSGRIVAEAQAVGRPVVTTAIGMLPENVVAPPRMRDDLRTGWIVRPNHPAELADAVEAALKLDTTAAEALGARARQFAEFMFSPHSVAEAIRGVYTSLLSRES
jgi:glycosyltransferase involved in cell wall biosynthesis